jgi:hypothetical protein
MESENDDEQSEGSSETHEPTEQQPPRSKLRDLRPEKDPMGAGNSAMRAELERSRAE